MTAEEPLAADLLDAMVILELPREICRLTASL